jgi:hypothetical protein
VIQQRTTEVNRIRKLLESANIKLGLVATELLGATGRAILRALHAGERDGLVLAELAKGTLRPKRARLAAALTGRFTDHHAALLGDLLDHITFLEQQIARLDERIATAIAPYADQVARLRTTPPPAGESHQRHRLHPPAAGREARDQVAHPGREGHLKTASHAVSALCLKGRRLHAPEARARPAAVASCEVLA